MVVTNSACVVAVVAAVVRGCARGRARVWRWWVGGWVGGWWWWWELFHLTKCKNPTYSRSRNKRGTTREIAGPCWGKKAHATEQKKNKPLRGVGLLAWRHELFFTA